MLILTEVKITEMNATLDIAMRNTLVGLIGEYLSEMINLRQFLAKVCSASLNKFASNINIFHRYVNPYVLMVM